MRQNLWRGIPPTRLTGADGEAAETDGPAMIQVSIHGRFLGDHRIFWRFRIHFEVQALRRDYFIPFQDCRINGRREKRFQLREIGGELAMIGLGVLLERLECHF